MTRPSPRVSTVGYQRPCAIFWTSVKRLVAGSKTATLGSPWKGSYCIVPLSISARPSCKSTMPLQNMSQDNEN